MILDSAAGLGEVMLLGGPPALWATLKAGPPQEWAHGIGAVLIMMCNDKFIYFNFLSCVPESNKVLKVMWARKFLWYL